MQDAKRQFLARHRLFETTDLDEARESVARVFCPHRLEVSGARQVAAMHNRVALPSFSLNYIQYGADVDIVPGALERFYLLQIPVAGHAAVACGAQSAEAGPSLATLLSPSQPVAMRWSADCRKLLVQIERDAVERTVEAMLGRPIGRPLDFDLALRLDTPALATLRRLILLLCDDIDAGPGGLTAGLAGARFGEAITTALLESQRHTYSDALAGKTPSIAPAHVRKAERYMREHVAEPIGLADVAASSGVSVRTLQEGFRRFRDTTPLEHLRTLRMESAHADLSEPSAGDTVTTIALRWGFLHLGRFSRAYREKFRESPSATLRRSGAMHDPP